MLTGSIRQFVDATLHSLKRSKTLASWRRSLSPSALFVELRCARRIDALGRRLTRMHTKIGTMSAHVLSGQAAAAVDADRNLRRMLAELKEDINAIRRDLALWHARECRGRTGPMLAAAIEKLNRIAATTYAAADRLEWDIEEHDRRYGR
jgi:hypothetical protein